MAFISLRIDFLSFQNIDTALPFAFYASAGFRETGEIVGNEIGMKLIVGNMEDSLN